MNFRPCNDPRGGSMFAWNKWLLKQACPMAGRGTDRSVITLLWYWPGVNYSADMFSAILIITLKYTGREREPERTYHTTVYGDGTWTSTHGCTRSADRRNCNDFLCNAPPVSDEITIYRWLVIRPRLNLITTLPLFHRYIYFLVQWQRVIIPRPRYTALSKSLGPFALMVS